MEIEEKYNHIMESNEEDDEIDLLELANAILKKWWIVLLSLLVGAALAFFGTKLLITPQYKATSMIYVYSKTTSITSLADLQIGSQLAVDFQIVATTREVVDKVIEKLNLDTTYEALLRQVEVSNPKGSHILQIDVKNPNPYIAADISNAFADELRYRIADVMNTDEPSVVDKAYVPEKPSSPSVRKNTMLGGLGLMFAAVAVIVVTFMMDDTIKTEADVKKYLSLNVLAEVPIERAQRKKA